MQGDSIMQLKKLLFLITLSIVFLFGCGKEQKDKEMTDMSIASLSNHPKLYDDYETAKEFYEGYDKAKVTPISTRLYDDDKIVLLSYDKEVGDYITSIVLNFRDSTNKESITLDQMIKVTCSYIPFDLFDKFYDFEKSFVETNKNGDYTAYHYVWVLNDEGKKTTNQYNKIAFRIANTNESEWVSTIDVLSVRGETGHWEEGAYSQDVWDIDLEQYRQFFGFMSY